MKHDHDHEKHKIILLEQFQNQIQS